MTAAMAAEAVAAAAMAAEAAAEAAAAMAAEVAAGILAEAAAAMVPEMAAVRVSENVLHKLYYIDTNLMCKNRSWAWVAKTGDRQTGACYFVSEVWVLKATLCATLEAQILGDYRNLFLHPNTQI